MSNFSISKKVSLLVLTPLVFQLLFVAALVFSQQQLEKAYSDELKARSIIAEISKAQNIMLEAVSYTLMEKSISLDKMNIAIEQPERWKMVAPLVYGERQQWKKRSVKNLREAADVWSNLVNLVGSGSKIKSRVLGLNATLREVERKCQIIEEADTPVMVQQKLMLEVFLRLRKVMPVFDQVIEDQGVIVEKEERNKQNARETLRLVVALGVAINLIMVWLLTSNFNRSTIWRLSTLMKNLKRLPAGEELLPEVGGNDEISNLDNAFHKMAAELKEARQRETAIISNSADVIFSLDGELEFTFVSKASERLWGYEYSSLQKTPVMAILPTEHHAEFRSALLEMSREVPLKALEFPVQRSDGTLLQTLWSICKSETEESWFCVAHDISERHGLARMRSEFISMLTHDIRTPVASVLLTYELLLEGHLGSLNKRGEQLVSGGISSIKHVVGLISDLLDLEKLEEGMLSVEVVEIEGEDLIDRALNAVQSQLDGKRLQLVRNIEPGKLQADPDLIIRVLINLLGNAIKYSAEESTVTIGVHHVEDGIEFAVADQGAGIPSEQLDLVFERYHQVQRSDAVAAGGAGLGLTICKSIVEAHNGIIGVDSGAGNGSRFWFRLPLRQDSTNDECHIE